MSSGQKTVLGTGDLTPLHSASGFETRNLQADRMAYVSTHVFDLVTQRRDRIQGDARTVAAFISAIHVGYLHPGDDACQTCSSGRRLVLGVLA